MSRGSAWPEWDELYGCGICGATMLGARLAPGQHAKDWSCLECAAPAGVVRTEPVTLRDRVLVLHRDALRLPDTVKLLDDFTAAMWVGSKAHEMTDAFFSSPEWRQRQDAQLAGLLVGMGFDTGAER